MDIDDILRDADRGLDGDPSASLENTTESDLQALTRAWINERGAPELLPWPRDNLVERVTEKIKKQIEKVEEMTGDMDPKTNFGLIVVQTELERWKFLVRGLLRCRISKIDAHTLYYLSTLVLSSRMSETEIAYATRHQQLLHTHYLSSFLSSFPVQLQNLNDTAGGISMIGGPDEESGVLVRGVGTGFGENGGVIVKGRGRDGDGEVEVQRGEVAVASRDGTQSNDAASKLQAQGLSVDPIVIDVTSDASVASSASLVTEKYGRIEVLFNNAGILRGPDSIRSLRAAFREPYESDVFGVGAVTDAFIPVIAEVSANRQDRPSELGPGKIE